MQTYRFYGDAASLQRNLWSAFLSACPMEVVLVFSTPNDAWAFCNFSRAGRIGTHRPTWVYLPLPRGLLRVRPASRGNVAFDFASSADASRFQAMILGLGTIYPSTAFHPHHSRTVYIGWSRTRRW